MTKLRKTRLLVGLAGVVAAVIVGGLALLLPHSTSAHGVSMFPGSRTYLCYIDGLRDNGQIIAYNPACADAIAQSGTTPLYNWFAVLDSNANGRTQGYVPDGTICSAGDKSPYDFSPYNMPRTDWPKTHLSAGATIEWRYSDWAKHPGTFHMYITKDSWDPTQPLAWDDLEAFWSVTDPASDGGPGTNDGHYYWDVQLPTGKTGDHMIFVQWVRSDSAENFFSCSDVVFDGGNGEVTGVGPDQGGPSNPPTTPPTTPPADSNCTVDYSVDDWGSGFTGTATVTSTDTNLSAWTVTWTWAGDQQVNQGWNAQITQSGNAVTAVNAPYNGTLAPGQSTSFGFNASYSSANPPPNDFTCVGT